MSRYEKVLNMLMDFDENIRLAIISNTKGEILWSSKRSSNKLQVPLSETKRALKRESDDWIDRSKAADRVPLGQPLYHITSFEKTKRVTLPIDAFHMLFLSVDNTPMKNTKKHSYGKLVEMGKILSIVDFVNTFE
ncbi:hypothetical protein Nisw_08660 [Candidatus Nitrosopumilus sp. SW]|uniref:hypothetical protein n=1 Tax=Candidatus Nitrosopumilus sp. SW TaxID=2508726 RepID=UPI00114EE37B|nr:hypothetical protein [Candidatus Nitrosopumilus sp. SW]QDI89584.1 hypothetical protein Nisw_08660 [Candidatus Nitrosopumilus sp. SW]